MASVADIFLVPLRLVTLAADPAGVDSAAGDMYFSSSMNKIRFYDGSAWADLAGGAGLASVVDDPAFLFTD